jgi:hypothetical protein
LTYADPVWIPRDLSEEGLSSIARRLEATLNRQTEEVDRGW